MQSIFRSARILPQYASQIIQNSIRMASTTTISSVIKRDHAEINTAYEKYVSAQGNTDEQQRWANQFRWELARHSAGEELLIYPSFEKNLGDEGKRMADEDRGEHQQIKNLLYSLETSSVTDANYRSTFDQLMSILTAHVKGEEENDIPKLEKVLSADENASLAQQFERTKMFVPTRAHPSAPDKPPFETVAGLLTAPLDKLRDLFDKFPQNK